MLRRYRAGECLNITGDIDGDGHHDIILRNRKNELSLYLYAKDAYPNKPDLTLPITAGEDFAVYDVNSDGLSDLIYYHRNNLNAPEEVQQIVYFAGINAL